jgi:putative acetyltransferase
MMAGYIVRNLCDYDLVATADLWFRSWHAAFPDLSHPMPHEAWHARLRDDIVPRCVCRIVTLGPTIIGFLAVELCSATLEQLFVDPSHQGRGVGKMLIDHAKQISPSGLKLTTLQRNAAAAKLYVREGFLRADTGINPVNGFPNIEYIWRPRAAS